MKIYTKQGDQGETGLLGGLRVAKDDLCIEVVGALDEVNCALGVVLSGGISPDNERALTRIQEDLFVIGSAVAAALTESARGLSLAPDRIDDLEQAIDSMDASLPAMDAFILPGGLPVSATLHQARGVCRRAERQFVSFLRAVPSSVSLANELVYLNRLGDLLFVMARFENHRLGGSDTKWLPVRANGRAGYSEDR